MIDLGETGRCDVIGAKYNLIFACHAPSECGNITRLCPTLFESARESSVFCLLVLLH